MLALVGGADPQDPITNLPDLKLHFPDSRAVILPHLGHQFGIGGCVNAVLGDFLARGTTRGLDTDQCVDEVIVPTFPLTN